MMSIFFKLFLNAKYIFNKQSFLLFIVAWLVLLSLNSCNSKEKDTKTENLKKRINFHYDLMNPDTVYKLPPYLKEISGISCYKKNKIACIQDEDATIYIFNTKKNKVTSKIKFAGKGDFEDIEIIGDDAYVLRSDGTIFKVENFKKKIKVTKFKTPLTAKNNTEGLTFDLKSNSLLIISKEMSSINNDNLHGNFKVIYSFDLKINELIKKPSFLIPLSKTDSIRKRGKVEEVYIEAAKKLKLLKNDDSFHPSGIAKHPFNNNLYIISAVEQLLVIINEKSQLLELIKLDKKVFIHPEGICFDKYGNMFVSNEGKKQYGNILKFSYIEKCNENN